MARKKKGRRPPGSGSVRKLPSGRFQARIVVAGRETSTVCRSLSAAQTWLVQQSARALSGTGPGDPRVRLRDLRSSYVAEMRARGYTVSTVRNSESHLDRVLEFWGDVRLRDLTSPRLHLIRDEMLSKGWAPSTVNNRLNRITGILRVAIQLGIMEPREIVLRRPRVTVRSRPDLYAADEVAALLEAAANLDDPRYLAAIRLARNGALRASEILRFRACDLIAGPAIVVPVRDAGDRPKSGRERQLPVPAVLVDAVEACGAAGDALVVNRSGWKYAANLWRWVRVVWQDAGVEPGTHPLHRFRHTWATWMLQRGVPKSTVMSWGGWSSEVALRWYDHGPDSGTRGPVDEMN